MVDKMKRSLAIVQDGDTATRNIAKDKFVNWKGNIYTANQAIASGSTLSAANGGNLAGCDDGALNNVQNKLDMHLITDPNLVNESRAGIVSNSSSMPDTGDYNLISFSSTESGYDFGIQIAIKRSVNIAYIRQRWGVSWYTAWNKFVLAGEFYGSTTETTNASGGCTVAYPTGFTASDSIVYAVVYYANSRKTTKIISGAVTYYNSNCIIADGSLPVSTSCQFLFRKV
jgi:hypothetical protein